MAEANLSPECRVPASELYALAPLRAAGLTWSSGKQRPAIEVVNGEHDAFETVPPDHGGNIVHSLPHGCRDLPKHRPTVVVFEGASVVALNPMGHERLMVFIEK
jgi:hypothetical protein